MIQSSTSPQHPAVDPAKANNGSVGWLSAHIPVRGSPYSADCDATIRELVTPLIDNCRRTQMAKQCFFIRYSEGGPHIRLRILPEVDRHAEVRTAIDASWMTYFRQQGPHAVPGRDLQWLNYEPELDRYGGQMAMPIAERLFDHSTTLACELLTPQVSMDRSIRLGRAMLATLTALHTFLHRKESVRQFARWYSQNYLLTQRMDDLERHRLTQAFDANLLPDIEGMREHLLHAWHLLSEHQPLFPTLDSYREALEDYRNNMGKLLGERDIVQHSQPLNGWRRAAWSFGTSMIHMTNNRLGVTITEESYIMHGLRHLLDVPSS